MVDVEEDNAYVGLCEKGHVVAFTLDSMRFELLFESGIVALLAGFHREAVSSIAAALERFYEFSIEAFAELRGVSRESFDTAWKSVASQSERQLGAYMLLYLTTFKRPFIATKEERRAFQDWTDFRNGVIHKGQFPTRKRALDYAQYVYELIRDRRAELRELDPSLYRSIESHHASRSHEAARQKKREIDRADPDGRVRGIGDASFGTMLTPAMKDAPLDFATRFEVAKKNLWVWGVRPRESVEARATPPADR